MNRKGELECEMIVECRLEQTGWLASKKMRQPRRYGEGFEAKRGEDSVVGQGSYV